MEKKYTIELTEEQLKLISMCVEDCHRFAAGQTQMFNMSACFDSDKRKEVRTKLDTIRLPQYDWAGNGCEDKSQRRFIAQTYGIYREIEHFFAIASDDGSYSVYNEPTLTCGESVPLPTIRTNESKMFNTHVSNKELVALLKMFPEEASVAIECCNPRSMSYNKKLNTIYID